MDWLYILMPISGVTIFWPGLVILGVGVGIIGGFFGMGGAWMVTPGLNILGFPMAFAIGTDPPLPKWSGEIWRSNRIPLSEKIAIPPTSRPLASLTATAMFEIHFLVEFDFYCRINKKIFA